MDMLRFLPYQWRSRLLRAQHDRAIRHILNTPPIVPRYDGLVLFSMIGTAVLLPYLVAVKSLWAQLGRGRIVILDDGTLTARDRDILNHHCGNPEILAIADVDGSGFPKGGCWERFLTILDRRCDDYIIQLDSDTVTLGDLPEVAQAIANNQSFSLLGGENSGDTIWPLTDFVEHFYPNGRGGDHVQLRIEEQLHSVARPEWRYFRGCAGFAGFSRGGPGRTLAAEFLDQMKHIIGPDDVAIWGTEQVASNFQIAQEADAVLLPYDRYRNYWGERSLPQARFLHFVGSHRYTHGHYAKMSKQAIANLAERKTVTVAAKPAARKPKQRKKATLGAAS